MIIEKIGTAASIEEAKQKAIALLAAPADADVKVEIVEMPKKKILGLFGGCEAKVKAFYDDGKEEKKPAQVKKEAPKAPPVKQGNKQDNKSEKKAENKPEKKAEPEKKEKPQAPKKEAVKAVKKEVPEIDFSSVEAKETDATNYLQSILVGMGFSDAHVTVKEADEDYYFEITCSEDYGNIIGRRGETLDALQYLTRLFVNRSSDGSKRVALNVGDYRERRAETLRNLAQHQAQRAIKIGRNCSLEPMNPYERRIIHTAIQGIEGVSSHSVGEGDNRRVVIVPENSRGGYSRDRRNYGGRREKRAPYVPENSAEPREQKVDAVSSSRYGKIEPKKPASAEESAE